MGPLTASDFSCNDIVSGFKERGLVLDAQGFCHEVTNGVVEHYYPPELTKLLPSLDVLKTNALEANLLVGEQNAVKAARVISQLGVREVIVTKDRHGSIISVAGEIFEVPA